MNMAQRTSSAAELNKAAPDAAVFGTPVSLLEFSPAQSPETGLFYLKNQTPTPFGDWVVMDGFYLSSHGDRPAVAILVYKDLIDGVFSEDKNIPSQITKAGAGVYFLSRDMAEYGVKKMLESNSTMEHAMAVCHGKTYNNLVDQLEERSQAGHFEDGMVLVVNVEQPDGDGVLPVIRGITEVLVNKKLQLVHVVANLERGAKSMGSILKLQDRKALINPMYYSNEAVAGFGYREILRGGKPMTSLLGGSYEDVIRHLTANSK